MDLFTFRKQGELCKVRVLNYLIPTYKCGKRTRLNVLLRCTTYQNQQLKTLDFTLEYEGTKYDLKGAIGLGVGEDWQEDDAWWCTELVAIILKRLGIMPWFDWDRVHRIAPLDCQGWPQKVIVSSSTYSWG